MKRKKIIIAFSVIILMISFVICNVVSICRYSSVSSDKKCDCAIVLGAACYESGVSNVYKERLNHSIILYNEKRVQKIIVTGGIGEGNTRTDAGIAKDYLISCGIPKDVILEESTSTITQENLENSSLIMSENGLSSALIVSDPLHMKRSMLLAKDAGIEAYPSPTQTSAYKTLKTKIPFTARETFFHIAYKIYRLFR